MKGAAAVSPFPFYLFLLNHRSDINDRGAVLVTYIEVEMLVTLY